MGRIFLLLPSFGLCLSACLLLFFYAGVVRVCDFWCRVGPAKEANVSLRGKSRRGRFRGFVQSSLIYV